ncbi:hypothetical protein HSRCO_2236 [Halanaeroarchaeum sp. HSR-CO]|nr:hypothetical protein HSRCO_2236 [Halanaeroarchaeum sp. HSR-CO]
MRSRNVGVTDQMDRAVEFYAWNNAPAPSSDDMSVLEAGFDSDLRDRHRDIEDLRMDA